MASMPRTLGDTCVEFVCLSHMYLCKYCVYRVHNAKCMFMHNYVF